MKRSRSLSMLWVLVLLCSILLGSVQAVAEESQKVPLLRIGTTQTQDVFSGTQTVGAFGKMLYNSFTHANLLEWDENGVIQPGFIQSWSFSEDGLEMTFTFPTDVVWHDGVPVTGEDVLFTFQPMVEQKRQNLSSVALIDEHTAKLTFTQPVGLRFLNTLTITSVLLPKHIWEGKDLTTYVGEDAVIGCGPYRFMSYDKDAQTSYYEAVGSYFKGELTVESVSIRTYTGQEALVMALANDEIDVIYDYSNPVDPALVETLLGRDAVDAGMSDNTGDYQLAFGCKTSPCDDLFFRKAVIHAIDYAMTASVVNGTYGSIPSIGIIAPPNLGFDDRLPALAQDLDAANAALDEGGYLDKDGDGMRELPDGSAMDVMITMQYGVRPEMFMRLFEVVSEDLAKVGIRTHLDEESVRNRDAWMSYMQQGNYELYLGVCTTGVAPFSSAYRYLLATSGLAAGTYTGEAMNAAYQQAMNAQTTAEYVAAIQEVQQLNATEFAGTALCWDKAFFPYRTDRFEGWINYPAWGAVNNKTWYTLTQK
ncbi:MAG TPA: ABC transporter substrate-binding protein [Clostridia bacterium]|nr:ABC transporter substrate-binding protein [Clostridia bacterium]